ncbi:prepilin-type N-terminal cleavage/methylation domain-containing protein [Planctomycetota bacterium]
MNNRGFTLIEIVVSLGVFLLGFVGVITLFLGGFSSQDEARTRVTEAIIADNLFAALKETEDPNLKPILTNVSALTTSGILDSVHYPGYSYFFTVEPYGVSGGQQNRLFVSLYVFETKFKEVLYEKEYSTLSEKEKADYDRNCIACYTIIDMES